MNSRIYVDNLPTTVTEETLHAIFAPHGRISHVFIALDRDTALPRGYAFVTYATPDEAQAGLAAVNGSEFEGRKLNVSVARAAEVAPVRSVMPRPMPLRRGPGGADRRPANAGGPFRR